MIYILLITTFSILNIQKFELHDKVWSLSPKYLFELEDFSIKMGSDYSSFYIRLWSQFFQEFSNYKSSNYMSLSMKSLTI